MHARPSPPPDPYETPDDASHSWTMHSPPGAETVLNGRPYLYFSGTGYLGLQGHPALIAAAQTAAAQYGVHTATTRGGFGSSPPVREVEQRASQFLGSQAAMYLVSGYAGNFAIMAGLSNMVDVALVDEFAHDCLRESTRWLDHLRRPLLVFRHRDATHLAELLRANVQAGERPLVLTDGVFATAGGIAPLGDYRTILADYEGAILHVDDAHGLATIGTLGRGSLELAGMPAECINRDPTESAPLGPRVYYSTTLSKAIGGHGGVIAGTDTFLDRVRRSSGWFRGASAPAAPIAAATAKGLELVQGDPDLRRRLDANVRLLRGGLANLGLNVQQSPSPIIGFSLDSPERMKQVRQRLLNDAIAIAYVRDYSGAPADGILRIAVFATHTPGMIDRLVDSLRRALLPTLD